MSEKHETTAIWHDGMSFGVELEGHRFTIDAAPEHGGQGRGPRPKGLVLSALAGCTGMDVVSILNKMRMPFDAFNLRVEGVLSETHPKIYETVKITYILTGNALDRAKIERAVSLSREQYCGVSAMIEGKVKIETEILLNP